MKTTRLYLVRHGSTQMTAEDRFSGAIGADLSSEGQQQAAKLGERLRDEGIAGVYASPFSRSVETARIVAGACGLAPILKEELREIGHGPWEGLTRREVEERFPDEYSSWEADPFTFAPRGAESGVAGMARALPVIREIVTAHEGQCVLVVSHKATIRLVLCSLLGIDARGYRDRLDQSPACLNVVDFKGPVRVRLTLFNDTSHYTERPREPGSICRSGGTPYNLNMRKTIFAFVIGVTLAVPAASQTVDEIVAKNIAALGGIDKIRAVKSIRMSGKMLVGPGIEAPIVMELKRPNAMRLDITVQGMVGSQAYDGTKGWNLMPFAGSKVPQEMAADEVKLAQEQAEIDGPLVDYKAKGSTVELQGKEKVEGADAYKLKVTLKSGDVRTMYIDAEHFLQIKEEAKRTIRGTEIESETIVGDYKEVGGMMFPHSIDSGQKGNPQRQKLTIEKIEINVPIDDTRFKMPEVK